MIVHTFFSQKLILYHISCFHIRAYTIQVPLPNIPTYVVALIASRSKEGAQDIADEHAALLSWHTHPESTSCQ